MEEIQCDAHPRVIAEKPTSPNVVVFSGTRDSETMC